MNGKDDSRGAQRRIDAAAKAAFLADLRRASAAMTPPPEGVEE